MLMNVFFFILGQETEEVRKNKETKEGAEGEN